MKKISLKIDVLKIPKEKIIPRTFKNRDGVEITIKELSLDVIQLNKPTVLKSGNGWVMKKTHFVSLAQSKEQIEAKENSVIIGDGITFENDAEAISASDIPFD